MMFKINRLKKNGVELIENVKYIPQYRINNALNAAYEQAGYREKSVLDNLKSIELNKHTSPGNTYITADLYGLEDESCQIIVFHDRAEGKGYKPGDITG